MLKDIKLTIIPLLVHRKDIAHAKTIKLTRISGHINSPEITTLQNKHTIIPAKSVAEKRLNNHVFCHVIYFLPTKQLVFCIIAFSMPF